LRPRDADIKAEIVDLFAVKLLNFIRNPFCIEKVLNPSPGMSRLILSFWRRTERSSPAESRIEPIFADSLASPARRTSNGCACCLSS
jgi:hypothetical protein